MKKTDPTNAAIAFLEQEFRSQGGVSAANLKRICSDGRMAGTGEWHCSLGNIYTTTPFNPGLNITVHGNGKKKWKFPVEEIYALILQKNNKTTMSTVSARSPKWPRVQVSAVRHMKLALEAKKRKMTIAEVAEEKFKIAYAKKLSDLK